MSNAATIGPGGARASRGAGGTVSDDLRTRRELERFLADGMRPDVLAAKPDLHATVIGSYMVSVVDSVGKSFASGQLERDGLR